MPFTDEMKQRIRQRDKWCCRIPGCVVVEDLHVHHIVFAGRGGPDVESNGLTVCDKHHKQIHGTWDDKQIIVLAKSGNPDDTPDANVGLKFKLVTLRPDNCQVCKGARGGVRGNENVVNGMVMCDYCHADDMKKRGVCADIVTAPEEPKNDVPTEVVSPSEVEAPASPGPTRDSSVVAEPTDYDITPKTRFAVEAKARYSRTYTGTINLGTFRELDGNKGARKRAQVVLAEGYRDVAIRYFELD